MVDTVSGTRVAAVRRMLEPRSLAVVGASQRNPFLGSLLDHADASGLELTLVHPERTELFGRPAVRSLGEANGPVDAVLSLVRAESTLDVVAQAAEIGAGGVIVTAAHFGEVEGEGAQRQRRLVEIARSSGLAVCGPNCLGAFNVAKDIHLYIGPDRAVRRGHVGLVSQSGGLLTTLQLAAHERRIGFSHMISSGNEAATDLVDYVDFLIEDPDTSVIAMVIEEIRRPEAFLEAVARARRAGIFLIALKLGRTPDGQRASASHTGALMTDVRDYEVAFRQHGVEMATDLDRFLGLLQPFSHFAADRWTPARRTAVLTASGGVAAMAADAFHESGLPLPRDEAVEAHARELVPGTQSANPLDITGVLYNESGFADVLGAYVASPAYDTILVVNYLQEGMEAFAQPMLAPLQRAAETTTKRLIAVTASETAIAPWAERLLDDGVALGSGLGATVTGLSAMTRFAERTPRPTPEAVDAIPQPVPAVRSHGVDLLPFAAGMDLLASFGIPTAPFVVWDPDRRDLPPGERFVVKLADVPHRSELGAVRVGLGPAEVPAAVADLEALASDLGLPSAVVVQPMLAIEHELFVGVQNGGAFGPLVVFGIGGIAVEALHDVTTRFAPLTRADADEMLDEPRAARLLDEFRGRAGVDRDALADVLVNAGRLALATRGWLASLDINPLIGHGGTLAAVDVSVIPSSPDNDPETPR